MNRIMEKILSLIFLSVLMTACKEKRIPLEYCVHFSDMALYAEPKVDKSKQLGSCKKEKPFEEYDSESIEQGKKYNTWLNVVCSGKEGWVLSEGSYCHRDNGFIEANLNKIKLARQFNKELDQGENYGGASFGVMVHKDDLRAVIYLGKQYFFSNYTRIGYMQWRLTNEFGESIVVKRVNRTIYFQVEKDPDERFRELRTESFTAEPQL
ncbi:MAG: hypothetical protein H7A25_07215 [Leptospiraceae bacterium]|nr:hypothetical protein [Leptospiraceae bacterium]MCP5499673.1 hypothetical protein [Leptospiraceae bacterium]